MGKRKRSRQDVQEPAEDDSKKTKVRLTSANGPAASSETHFVQIVAGSYERILHGVIATFRPTSISDANTDSDEI